MHLDLHRHLEGSHSPTALLEVARRFDVRQLPFYDPARGAFRTPEELATALVMAGPTDDASVFYRCIVEARAAYVSVEAIGALAELAFAEAAADCDGFEMRLSLFSMTRTLLENQGLAWREVAPTTFADVHARSILRAVIAAADRVRARTGCPLLLRLGLSRTFESAPHYRALADMVVDHARDLVGLDVLGIVSGPDKEPMPPALVDILTDLRRHLPDLTIHAGELEGSASVDRTLLLDPQGIGHGVRALEDPRTVEALVQREVTLEVCPSSNRLLIGRVIAALEAAHGALPLVALQRAGVRCVMGSDDPTPMGTSYRREREVAHSSGVDMARLERDARRRWAQISGRPLPE